MSGRRTDGGILCYTVYTDQEGVISGKQSIDCARLPREAMFVALPRKVAAERTLPRARTWRVSSQIGAVLCPAAKGF
jgi:hypothetical protein